MKNRTLNNALWSRSELISEGFGMNHSFTRFRGPRRPREVSEFKEKTLEIRRVTRVVAGGKRFSFRATVVLGDLKGRVGLGVAKGLDVASAIGKAKLQAKKKMIRNQKRV